MFVCPSNLFLSVNQINQSLLLSPLLSRATIDSIGFFFRFVPNNLFRARRIVGALPVSPRTQSVAQPKSITTHSKRSSPVSNGAAYPFVHALPTTPARP